MVSLSFIYFYIFEAKSQLCSSGWPATHYVAHNGLSHPVPGLQASSATHRNRIDSQEFFFINIIRNLSCIMAFRKMFKLKKLFSKIYFSFHSYYLCYQDCEGLSSSNSNIFYSSVYYSCTFIVCF